MFGSDNGRRPAQSVHAESKTGIERNLPMHVEKLERERDRSSHKRKDSSRPISFFQEVERPRGKGNGRYFLNVAGIYQRRIFRGDGKDQRREQGGKAPRTDQPAKQIRTCTGKKERTRIRKRYPVSSKADKAWRRPFACQKANSKPIFYGPAVLFLF